MVKSAALRQLEINKDRSQVKYGAMIIRAVKKEFVSRHKQFLYGLIPSSISRFVRTALIAMLTGLSALEGKFERVESTPQK